MAKYKRATSPEGVAYYPWLQKPDVKFQADKGGNYKCDIFVDAEDAKPLIKKIDDTKSEYKLLMEKTENKKFSLNDVPYIYHGDEVRDSKNAIPKGKVKFNIKQYGLIGGKPFRPIVVDSVGKPMVDSNGENIAVFGGSKVKVSFDLFTYSVGCNLGCALKLVAVQVLELQDSAEPDLSKLGFKEEKGYNHSQENIDFNEGDTASAKKEEISNSDFI